MININEWHNFEGFSELSLAALTNDDMQAFLKENTFRYKGKNGKWTVEPVYTMDGYLEIREVFLEWKKERV
jgi:hypothetical protein